MLTRITQAKGPARECKPMRNFQVATWRDGSRHFPLIGKLLRERTYNFDAQTAYDVKWIDYDLRTGSGRIHLLRDSIDSLIRQAPPTSWLCFNSVLHQARISRGLPAAVQKKYRYLSRSDRSVIAINVLQARNFRDQVSQAALPSALICPKISIWWTGPPSQNLRRHPAGLN